ncbi:MAG: hypothetical protein JST28_05035 [Acidobacteria bacterium]|nr:hypothetical protein [Acidobacteriota bacterium]
MKILAVTILFYVAALPLWAATQVTVAELERTVASARSAPDDKLADELSGLELTQRISASALTRLQSGIPGPKARQQLAILSDQSAFLDLPPRDIPSTPAPNVATQRQIMTLVVNYVTQTIHQLPNFLATRETRSFEDRPAGAYSYQPLRLINQTSANVVYREGQERDTRGNGKLVNSGAGLVSWGEFGPILSTVLLDAAKGQLAWSHWEQDAVGVLAAFRYAVPAKSSHYQIQFCCESDWQPGLLVAGSSGGHLYQRQAAYHGEIAVDPATGAIYRMTVIADLGTGNALATASMAVQYGPVEIGGKSYICPLHSEAIAQSHQVQNRQGTIPSTAISQGPLLTRLNEVTFEHYRLFRSESRILTDAEAAQITGQSDDDSTAVNTPAPAAEPERHLPQNPNLPPLHPATLSHLPP